MKVVNNKIVNYLINSGGKINASTSATVSNYQKIRLSELYGSSELIVQWGNVADSSNIAAGSSWSVTVTPSVSYKADYYYEVIATIKGSSAGGELYITAQTASSFTIKIYNRNSSTVMTTPSINWITIGV